MSSRLHHSRFRFGRVFIHKHVCSGVVFATPVSCRAASWGDLNFDEHSVAAPPDEMRLPPVECHAQPRSSHGDMSCTCCQCQAVRLGSSRTRVSHARHRLRSFVHYCVVMGAAQFSVSFTGYFHSDGGFFCPQTPGLVSTLVGRRNPKFSATRPPFGLPRLVTTWPVTAR